MRVPAWHRAVCTQRPWGQPSPATRSPGGSSSTRTMSRSRDPFTQNFPQAWLKNETREIPQVPGCGVTPLLGAGRLKRLSECCSAQSRLGTALKWKVPLLLPPCQLPASLPAPCLPAQREEKETPVIPLSTHTRPSPQTWPGVNQERALHTIWEGVVALQDAVPGGHTPRDAGGDTHLPGWGAGDGAVVAAAPWGQPGGNAANPPRGGQELPGVTLPLAPLPPGAGSSRSDAPTLARPRTTHGQRPSAGRGHRGCAGSRAIAGVGQRALRCSGSEAAPWLATLPAALHPHRTRKYG